MVAFSNTAGGMVLIGVANDGSLPGLAPKDVIRINQIISNAATQHMRSPISPETCNVSVGAKRVVIVLTIHEGLEKPYFDRKGVIWVKAGSDKRRIQSKEELRRLFQEVDLVQADEVATSVGINGLDRMRFGRFLEKAYGQPMPENDRDLVQLVENMNLARQGRLNLAGLLLFGAQPQAAKAAFVIKAVAYPNTSVAVNEYLDSEDFGGTLDEIYKGALAFITRSLPKRQVSGVNEPGRPVVPQVVFEELLVNALIHRDYFIQAPIRLFVFTDRVEIVSPGSLPNHLTVEKIRAGNSVIRNSVLASFAAKGVLPYRGLGTGIIRALSAWQSIELIDDREACTFAARIGLLKVHPESEVGQNKVRFDPITQSDEPIKTLSDAKGEPIKGLGDTITRHILARPDIAYEELAEVLGVSRSTILRHIQALKGRGILHRVGSKKTGHWDVRLGCSPRNSQA